MVSKITATIESVPIWGDENFDANVHENFLKLKELGPQLNKTIDDINKTFNDIDSYTKTTTNKANEATQSASDANNAKQTATQQAEIATTKAGEAVQSASDANNAKTTAMQQADIATTKASEATQSASDANNAKQTATQQADIAITKASEATNIKNEMQEIIDSFKNVTKDILELDQVDNTSDKDKPISIKTKEALDALEDAISKLDIIPKGIINMWSGTIANIPSGWALCNGQNGTPDLRDKFIVGAGASYDVDSTGGSKDAIVVSHSHTQASHTHTATAAADGAHTHNISISASGAHAHTLLASSVDGINSGTFKYASYTDGTDTTPNITSTDSIQSSGAHSHTGSATTNGAHTHTITNSAVAPTIASTGENGKNANLPPYYALAFIMKI
ncbi:hypothetical protein [Aliarcobacter butzleri]|uniref:hypothetical protein n=1 Tax=Aliarcobacter butzleri TaxID=28197 RepID=UPI002B245670|nr:hypothetical protein [Aliarcobacter butzleri]